MSEISLDNQLVSLRSVAAADEDSLLRIYASTRAAELDLVPWSEQQKQAFLRMQFDAQHQHYRNVYPEAEYQVIVAGNEIIGRLYLAREPDEIRILDLTLLPEFRSRGVGSQLLSQLIAESSESGRALRIHVESFSPALRLFTRLGFEKVQENGIYYLLEWLPTPALAD